MFILLGNITTCGKLSLFPYPSSRVGDTSELVSNAVLDEFKKLKDFLLHCSSSETTVCLQLLGTLVGSLPRLLTKTNEPTTQSKILSLWHCCGCIRVGLTGLVRATGIVSGPRGSDVEGDGSLRGILKEHMLSFWSPTEWTTVPQTLATVESDREDIQGVCAIVRTFAETVLIPSSVRGDLFLLLNTPECKADNGASCDTDDLVESSLGELVLHLLYQTLLLRGNDSSEFCESFQSMAPELLSMLARDDSTSLEISVSSQCISRSLALMCLRNPILPGAGKGIHSSHAEIDIGFVQTLTRSLHHKASSAVVGGSVGRGSLSTIQGVVLCVEAMMEVFLSSSIGGQSESFCVQFCVDVFLNSLDCLERFTTIIPSKDPITKLHYQYLKPDLFGTSGNDATETPRDLTGIVAAVLRLMSTAAMGGALAANVDPYCLSSQLSTRLFDEGAGDRTLTVLLLLIDCFQGKCDALMRYEIIVSFYGYMFLQNSFSRKLGSDPIRSQQVLLAASLDAVGRLFLNGGHQTQWQSKTF